MTESEQTIKQSIGLLMRERDEQRERAERAEAELAALRDRFNRLARICGKEHERYQRLWEKAEPQIFSSAILRGLEAAIADHFGEEIPKSIKDQMCSELLTTTEATNDEG